MRHRNRQPRRRGIAIVEAAFILPLLLVLLAGVWEAGRIVQVSELLNNAVREGARVAAQSEIIAPVGGFTYIHTSTGIPNVQDTVREYLFNAGVISSTQVSDVQVTFKFLTGDTSRTDPYQGNQGDTFQVSATLPLDDVNWTPFSMAGYNLQAQVTWVILLDSTFTVNTTIPGWSP